MSMPSNSNLKPVKYGKSERDKRSDGEIYTIEGSFTNELGERLILKTSGRSLKRLQQYLKNVRVNFEILPQNTVETKPGKAENSPMRFSTNQLFALDKENIRIELSLAPETLAEKPVGVVVFMIDPQVRATKFDNYAAQNTNGVSFNISLKAPNNGGGVKVSVYRQCSRVAGPTTVRNNTISPNFSSSMRRRNETGWFDLTIEGIDIVSTYTISGSWGLASDPVDANKNNVTCQ
jgi:hypothetical protein